MSSRAGLSLAKGKKRAVSPAAIASSSKRVTRAAVVAKKVDVYVENDDEDEGVDLGGSEDEDEDEENEEAGEAEEEEDEDEDLDDDDLEIVEQDEDSEPRSRGKGRGKQKEKEESSEKSETPGEKLARIVRENPGLEARKLRLAMRSDVKSLDIHDPREFKALKGTTERVNEWRGTVLRKSRHMWPQDFEDARQNTEDGLTRVLKGRKKQVAEGRTSAIASSNAAILKEREDMGELAQEIMKRQDPNTTGVLGLPKCIEEQMANMAGFKAQMLKGRLVYEGIVFQDDAMVVKHKMDHSKDVYVGKSTNKLGAGARVLGDHEKSVRKARDGIADSHFLTCGLCQRAAIPGARAYIRPVWHEDRGESETDSESRAADDFTGFCEVVVSDFEQSLKMDGRQITVKETGKLLNDPSLKNFRAMWRPYIEWSSTVVATRYVNRCAVLPFR